MTAFVGRSFVGREGEQELLALRIDAAPKATGDSAPIEMLARVPSEECGCPEELWRIDGILLLLHLEEDGDSDAFIFAGDWDAETTIKAHDLDDLRAKSFQWLADTIRPADIDCRDIP